MIVEQAFRTGLGYCLVTSIDRQYKKREGLALAKATSMASTNHDMVRTLKGEVYDLMVKEECLWYQ